MTPVYLACVLALIVAQLALPLRLGFAPLLIALCTLPNMVVVDVGVAFTLTKLLILTGLIRAITGRTLVWSSRNPLDLLFAVWACWAVISSFGHNPADLNPLTVRLSLVYDYFGTYLYARSYLGNYESVLRFAKLLAACMIVLAAMMTIEKTTSRNLTMTIMTGSMSEAQSRGGKVRAGGTFMHPILAGTVGATSGILLAFLGRRNRRQAILVAASCGLIVYSSASSGPIMTLGAGLGALILWRWRTRLSSIRTLVILTIVGLHFAMEAPVWYLMARVDLAGGSTGWHRAELISQALAHINRWWFMGTDYTRDWFAYGLDWSPYVADITNLYIQMGVTGGLPLMVLFIAILAKTFQLLGRQLMAMRSARDPREFMSWCFGAALFAHCITFLSVTYFDQSYASYCLLIGAVPGHCIKAVRLPRREPIPTVEGHRLSSVC